MHTPQDGAHWGTRRESGRRLPLFVPVVNSILVLRHTPPAGNPTRLGVFHFNLQTRKLSIPRPREEWARRRCGSAGRIGGAQGVHSPGHNYLLGMASKYREGGLRLWLGKPRS